MQHVFVDLIMPRRRWGEFGCLGLAAEAAAAQLEWREVIARFRRADRKRGVADVERHRRMLRD